MGASAALCISDIPFGGYEILQFGQLTVSLFNPSHAEWEKRLS